MQLDNSGKNPHIIGYGVVKFNDSAIQDGVIEDYEALAKATNELFTKDVIGEINTRRVAATIPSSKAYSRIITLPAKLDHKELEEAVRLEANQYIPIPIEDLYIDFEVASRLSDEVDVLVVGVPRNIIDSYMKFFDLVGLEVCSIETTISAASRLVSNVDSSSDIPTILIDLGSLSVDLTVFDKSVVVNGTVPGGGDDFSNRIAEKLSVTKSEANSIKTKYGLGVSKHQTQVREALKPQLESLIKEVRRVIRYYEERTEGKNTIGQIITMGGGANMPGLVEYLTDNLRIATRMCSFWSRYKVDPLQPPAEAEKSLYITVAGAASAEPSEVWK